MLLIATASAAAAEDHWVDKGGPLENPNPLWDRGNISPNAAEWKHTLVGVLVGNRWQERLRFGAEVQVGKYNTELLGLPALLVKRYDIRTKLEYVPYPNSFSPYAGLGVAVIVNRFEDEALESIISAVRMDAFGLGVTGIGYLGFQFPIGPRMSLFGEGRAGVDVTISDAADLELGSQSLQGFSGLGGIRMRF